MIKSAMQLKAKIRNLAKGNSNKAQTLLRNFIMERFLERISLSPYKDNFILKGGMLVSAIVGIDYRTTMDIDTTIKDLKLDVNIMTKMVEELMNIDVFDGVTFKIQSVGSIMEDFDYPGLRYMLEASFDGLHQPIKIDISTGDIITPSAIQFNYKLMFEDRYLKIKAYNIETLLAEKLETIMSRGDDNTRLRDFYDVYYIWNQEKESINLDNLVRAFFMTSTYRKTYDLFSDIDIIINKIRSSNNVVNNWNSYKNKTFFIDELSWKDVLDTVSTVFDTIKTML